MALFKPGDVVTCVDFDYYNSIGKAIDNLSENTCYTVLEFIPASDRGYKEDRVILTAFDFKPYYAKRFKLFRELSIKIDY